MKKNDLLTYSAGMLMLIGAAMIIIGFVAQILPPPLTGVGFIFIAVVFLKLREHKPE